MTMKIETLDTIAKAGNSATNGGAAVAATAWVFFQSNAGWITGLLVALLGLWVNTYYKRKSDKRRIEQDRREEEANLREAEAHKQRMALRQLEADQKMAERALRMDLMRRGIPVGPPPSDFADLEPMQRETIKETDDDDE